MGMIGLLVQKTGDASLTEVARSFGRDLSIIRGNVAAARRLIEGDEAFDQRYREAKLYATSQARPRNAGVTQKRRKPSGAGLCLPESGNF